MGKPVVPGNLKSPLADVARVKKARKAQRAALTKVQGWLISEWNEVPVRKTQVNADAGRYSFNQTYYEYLIDLNSFESIMRRLTTRFRQEMQDTTVPYVRQAYEIGTANSVTNMEAMTEAYPKTVEQVVLSDPYQTRIAFVESRVFEEMEGFQGETITRLRRILSDAMSQGTGPARVAKDIRKEFSQSASRAERIARTEITGAQRRARWDEAQYAQQNYGIRTKLMHVSALLPTSRWEHMNRHGQLFTIPEVRQWYSVDGNAINCRCSQIEILVDEDGFPRYPDIVERALGVRKRFLGNAIRNIANAA